MKSASKMAVLVALVGVTVCLSVALVGLSHVQAEATPQQDAWIADDAARAVETLLDTSTFTYLDHAHVPGMFREEPGQLKFKALRSKKTGIKISDGSVAYLASPSPSKGPYKTKNAFPKILWTPKTLDGLPAVQLKGERGTTFEKVGNASEPMRVKTAFRPILTDRDGKKPDKFAISLRLEEKTGKKAVTEPKWRIFKGRIERAKKEGRGSASAFFPGSFDDEPALFVPIVRVQGGKPTDFKVTKTRIR